MAKGDDIEVRLVDFAVRIINLCDNLPRTRAGNHIAGQLLRSGTALPQFMQKLAVQKA